MSLHKQKKIVYFARYLMKKTLFERALLVFSLSFHTLMLYGQQDIQYNQLFFNQAVINPGFSGSDTSGLFNAIAFNKTEMTGFEGAPTSTLINVNGPMKIGSVNSGVGITFSSESFGKFKLSVYSLAYAYRLQTERGRLGIGVSLGSLFSNLDSGGWIYPNSNGDPTVPTEKASKQNFDASIGAYYELDKWDIGLSINHLTQPAITVADQSAALTRSYNMYGGYNFRIAPFRIKTFLLVYSDLVTSYQTLGVVGFYQDKYWAGLNYSVGSQIGILAGLTLFKDLKLGYNFLYNTSALSKYGGGTHEIMINYKFYLLIDKGKQKYKSVRYL